MLESSDMENIVEMLKMYFNTTSKENVIKDWEKTKDFDQIGPTMDEFLKQTNWHFKIKLFSPLNGQIHTINYCSPKFSSGFLLTNHPKYAKSSIFDCNLSI